MKRLILGIVGTLYVSLGFAQRDDNKIGREVDVLKVKNEALLAVLDTVLISESQKYYYSQDLVYSIHQGQNNIVTIGALGEGRFDTDEEFGLIAYKNHLFFVEGQKLDGSLFRRTNKKFVVPFLKDNSGKVDPKTGEIFVKLYLDEYYDIWVYERVNKEFRLLRHVCM